MYGAFIGDIVGSKYEFHNIKTKQFPLFSQGCDYTDDTIMTVAVAKAILLSRREQIHKSENGKPFQDFLIETMQDFGRRYPNPAGSYGGSFSKWLREENPKPYGSYGNGAAMRVSPCGLAAVMLDEALALARASASVTHDHPEGIKGAQAVSAAIFLAKIGHSKDDIRQYITENFYDLDFTLDSIRANYRFDESCQGTVPQAIIAFLESESYEDAIRNAVSIGGDSDTLAAITGSIAWVYYAVKSSCYGGWANHDFDPAMLLIEEQAKTYLPREFIEIAEEFHEVCWQRAGTNERVGGCTSILNRREWETFSESRKEPAPFDPVTKEIRDATYRFCSKYVVLMEVLYRDKDLNQWCRNYSAYRENTEHCELEKIIYHEFMTEAYHLGFMPQAVSWTKAPYSAETALNGTDADLIGGIFAEIRQDYGCNGSLIYNAIAKGNLYRLMHEFLSREQMPKYTLEYIMAQKNQWDEKLPGACRAIHDQSCSKWRLRIQLDPERVWFLSVFVREDGAFEKYSLDKEVADDSHYAFVNERKIREALYEPGDETRFFHEILIRYVKGNGGNALLRQINPYITAKHHFY